MGQSTTETLPEIEAVDPHMALAKEIFAKMSPADASVRITTIERVFAALYGLGYEIKKTTPSQPSRDGTCEPAIEALNELHGTTNAF